MFNIFFWYKLKRQKCSQASINFNNLRCLEWSLPGFECHFCFWRNKSIFFVRLVSCDARGTKNKSPEVQKSRSKKMPLADFIAEKFSFHSETKSRWSSASALLLKLKISLIGGGRVVCKVRSGLVEPGFNSWYLQTCSQENLPFLNLFGIKGFRIKITDKTTKSKNSSWGTR